MINPLENLALAYSILFSVSYVYAPQSAVLFSVSPFNPFAFFIPLLLGLGPLVVGLYGDRKTVFQLLFISGS